MLLVGREKEVGPRFYEPLQGKLFTEETSCQQRKRQRRRKRNTKPGEMISLRSKVSSGLSRVELSRGFFMAILKAVPEFLPVVDRS